MMSGSSDFGSDYDQDDQTMFDIDRVKSKLLSMQKNRAALEDRSNSVQSNFINEISYPEGICITYY